MIQMGYLLMRLCLENRKFFNIAIRFVVIIFIGRIDGPRLHLKQKAKGPNNWTGWSLFWIYEFNGYKKFYKYFRKDGCSFNSIFTYVYWTLVFSGVKYTIEY